MRILSLNIGVARPRPGAPAGTTGIFKRPVAGPVRIAREGLPGDAICSLAHHGGPDQAVYLYGQVDYDWWAAELGRGLAPGTFGENLTVAGLESTAFSVGDRLFVGDALVLEVTAPRIPCGTFAARMGEPEFVKRFREAERPGLYCRVLEEGAIDTGDPVRREPVQGDPVSLIELFRDHYEPDLTESAIRRLLAAPLASRARRKKEEQLAKLQAGVG